MEIIKARKYKFGSLSFDEQIEIMRNNKDTYWHNGKISYMGMSYVSEGQNKECNGLGVEQWHGAQLTEYTCSLCRKNFYTEGE